jgi:pteridine reductase
MDLKGRHVLVTGAAKRLGRAIAERLLDYDIKLTGHYRTSAKELDELAALAKSRGRELLAVQADLADVPALQRAVDQAVKRFGPVAVLVSSASDFYPTPALDCTEKDWDHFQDVNLKGQFFLAQAVARTGMKQAGGVILNLGDVNGERPIKNFAPYLVSKAGLLHLTRALALEWGPSIRVNAISPGAVLLPENYTPEQVQRSIDRSLLKRLGTAADIVEAAVFLIQNDYITGFDLKVDGGRILS